MAEHSVVGSHIASVAVAFPPHVYRQEELAEMLREFGGRAFDRFSESAGVRTRHLALPLERYPQLTGFTEANAAYADVALELGERALTDALEQAGIRPDQVDVIASTTVTGLTVPSLEARLAGRIGLRPDVKRLPLFGLGCVAGAAGVARLHDYLRGHPSQVAVLLAVELCSLTLQHGDVSPANAVATSLFGDGAAAVVLSAQGPSGPAVIDSRSRLYPQTEQVMGWDIGAHGLKIVLSTEVAVIAERYLGDDVRGFLKDHQLELGDITAWVTHPGGPKVIDAIERVLSLPPSALAATRKSLAEKGNLSSVSVLDVLLEVLRTTTAQPGDYGLMMAMGPGFCSELVLLRW